MTCTKQVESINLIECKRVKRTDGELLLGFHFPSHHRAKDQEYSDQMCHSVLNIFLFISLIIRKEASTAINTILCRLVGQQK